MNILILGSGGREHAFAWKIAKSSSCNKLFIAPGNAGTGEVGENVDINVNDFKSIKEFVLAEEVELVLVGPEEPLVNGIYDFFQQDSKLRSISLIGPSAAGAQLEGSKKFAKEFMMRHDIPTARYQAFTKENLNEGYDFIDSLHAPYVLKADGLAAGKGVLIIDDLYKAKKEFKSILNDNLFGAAGNKVVIEEFLNGEEMSYFIISDGITIKNFGTAQDHKRVHEGDKGKNTGGMGAYSPSRLESDKLNQKIINKIIIYLTKNNSMIFNNFC